MNLDLALRRLPWYILFSIVLGPLILAPFTLGFSLWWYAGYIAAPFDGWMAVLVAYGIPILIGTLIWFIRVFLVCFAHSWYSDHTRRV